MKNSFLYKTSVTQRKTNTEPLKEAIDQFLNIYKLKKEFDAQYIVANWEKIMGTAIANRTVSVSVENKKLFLKISSAPLRNELALMKQKLIDLLNQKAGSAILEEIIFI